MTMNEYEFIEKKAIDAGYEDIIHWCDCYHYIEMPKVICSWMREYAATKLEEYKQENELSKSGVVGRSEQLVCDCENCKPFINYAAGFRKNKTCINGNAN